MTDESGPAEARATPDWKPFTEEEIRAATAGELTSLTAPLSRGRADGRVPGLAAGT